VTADKQVRSSPSPFPGRIARALERTEQSFDEWLVERGKARALAWQARYWPGAPVPLHDTKYLWPHVFKQQGHRAMLVTGYPEKGSGWDDLRAFHERESIVVGDTTYTPPAWTPLVKAVDRRDLTYTALLVLFKAIPVLASLLGMRHLFNTGFRLLVRRPLVLYLVAPGSATRTLPPSDEAEATARELTVTFDATGIACTGSFEDARIQLTRSAIKDLCGWALAAAKRATLGNPARNEPGGVA
jgi:hypothetical protein